MFDSLKNFRYPYDSYANKKINILYGKTIITLNFYANDLITYNGLWSNLNGLHSVICIDYSRELKGNVMKY